MTRTVPYKDVTRAKCERCGKRAAYQWSGACAERRSRIIYHPLCADCDREGNELTMTWLHGKAKAKELMRGYE